MPDLNILNQIITFPDDSASPDWAQGVISFAEAVTLALSSVTGPFDVAPQTMDISSANAVSDTAPINNLTFSTTGVQAVSIQIAVLRTSDIPANTVAQYNTLMAVFNVDATPPWNMSTEGVGDAGVTYSISNTGVVSYVINTAVAFTTTYTANLSYSAKALQTPQG
jgi:hypothetical protein